MPFILDHIKSTFKFFLRNTNGNLKWRLSENESKSELMLSRGFIELQILFVPMFVCWFVLVFVCWFVMNEYCD